MILYTGIPFTDQEMDQSNPDIHECRCESFETEARRGFSQVRPTQAYLQSVEEAEREKPRRTRESDDGAGIHE
jgi:hypothetical protein